MRKLKPQLLNLFSFQKHFLRRALQDDFSVIHNENSVRLQSFIHVVRYCYNRNFLFFIEPDGGFHNFPAAGRVKHCRCFIQNNALRFHRQYSGNRNPLFLTARKVVRRAFRKFRHIYTFQCPLHALPDFCRRNPQIFRAERNIFVHNGSDYLVIGILKNHPDFCPYIPHVFFVTAVHSVNPKRSFFGRQKRIEMTGKRGFARPVSSQDADKLPFFDFETYFVNCGFLSDFRLI